MATAPVARPSSPSVRLTAFVVAVEIRLDQITKRIAPVMVPKNAKSHDVSRNTEIAVEAGGRPFSLGKFRASTAKVIPTAPWPIILPIGVSPKDRWFEIFM